MGGKSEPRFLQRLHTLGRTSLDSNAILASEPWLVASKKLWRRLCKVALRLGLGPKSNRKDRHALSPYQAWRCRGARMRE
jgi:phage terminase small subunit